MILLQNLHFPDRYGAYRTKSKSLLIQVVTYILQVDKLMSSQSSISVLLYGKVRYGPAPRIVLIPY